MLKQRILTALVALPAVAVILFVLPEMATRLIFSALMLLAAWEWSGLLNLKTTVGKLSFVGFVLGVAVVLLLFVPEPIRAECLLMTAVLWWVAAFAWLFFHPTKIPPAIGWLCGALIIVPAWYSIDWLYLRGSGSLIVVLLIVFAADTGAYFAGKLFGRVKLAPSISPGKTWEGVIGGMFLVAALAAAVAAQSGGSLAVYLPLFLAIAVLSIVGDLTVSVFKRHAGVKDSGKLFPGHGGVLDRIDSVAAATPVYALATLMAAIK